MMRTSPELDPHMPLAAGQRRETCLEPKECLRVQHSDTKQSKCVSALPQTVSDPANIQGTATEQCEVDSERGKSWACKSGL